MALLAAGVALAAGIWNAWRDWRGPNRLIVPLRVSTTATAQLFYDQGQGIRAEDSVSVPIPGGGSILRELAFPVPRAPLRQLRFDPMPFPGSFAVGRPRLESASGRVIAKFPIPAVVPLYQIGKWRLEGDHWTGASVPDGDDPQLTFGLGAPLRVGTPRLPWIEVLAVFAAGGAVLGLRRREELRGVHFGAVVGSWLAPVGDWARGPGRGPWLAGAVFVAVVQLWLLWPLQHAIDWPLWDEANYAARGVEWAAHGGSLGALHSSPLFVVMYAALSWLGDLGAMIAAQHYVVKLASAVLLYFVLASWWRSAVAAAAVAALWAASAFQLEWPMLVYQAAWLWFLAALLTADRWPLATLGFTALATCVRQEYQLAGAVLLAWYGWRAWRLRRPWHTWFAQGRGWLGGAVLAAMTWAGVGYMLAHSDLAVRDSSARMWFAFEQHYAARAVNVGEVKGIDPWLDYGQVIQRDFPGANSLRSAWQINAVGVRHHLEYNLTHTVSELAGLGKTHAGLEQGAWALLAAGLLALAAATGGGRRGDNDAARKERGSAGRVEASAVLATAALVAIAPGLIVMAKGSYLLALVPGVLGAAGWLWLRAMRWTIAWRDYLAAAGLLALAAGGGLLACGPQPFVPGDRPRPVAETVAELKKIWPTTGREPLLAVAATSYAQYLGEDRCQAVEALAGATGRTDEPQVSVERVLTEVKPWAVLVTEEWRASPRFDGEKLARLLAGPEWTERDVPEGRLYVRAVR